MEDQYRQLGHRVPAGRAGEAHEYTDLTAFPVSKRAVVITGAAINLDG